MGAAWLCWVACVHELVWNSFGACKMTSRSLLSVGRELSYYCQIMPQLKHTHYHACHKTSVPTWRFPQYSMQNSGGYDKVKKAQMKWVDLLEKKKNPSWISAYWWAALFSGYAKESFLLIGKRRINLSPKCFWHSVNFFLKYDWPWLGSLANVRNTFSHTNSLWTYMALTTSLLFSWSSSDRFFHYAGCTKVLFISVWLSCACLNLSLDVLVKVLCHASFEILWTPLPWCFL